ncbi:protein FAM47E [Crotalus adamanteus]|uniref:Protein FAM47E n=1 Tax=Crotalus adamanteus TaxID=8729 RepID=A0AAW1BA97_CROAD
MGNEQNLLQAEAELESSLHGTYAFEQFLERKGYRKPQFLMQMLAASRSDKIAEDSRRQSRRQLRNAFTSQWLVRNLRGKTEKEFK